MIVVRGVFQAKYGKGDELVELFKEAARLWPELRQGRLLTDLSGPFFTVVSEGTYADFGEWEEDARRTFSAPGFSEWFERMVPLVESGRREFYSVAE